MTLFLDESVSGAIIDRLRADGHALLVMRDIAAGAPDEDVLARAVAAQAVLLTEDKDFGELVYHSGIAHRGVVLIRLAGLPRDQTRQPRLQSHPEPRIGTAERVLGHQPRRGPHPPVHSTQPVRTPNTAA